MSLSDKQLAFVNEYLVDFNATQAAIRAGYSERSARQIASQNLSKHDIQAAIRERVASAEEVLIGLTDIARGDIADLMDITPSGFTFRLIEEKNGERAINPKTKLIRKIKQKVTTSLSKTEDGEDKEIIETEIELYSRHEALRDLGKFHKLFTDKVDLTSNGEKIDNGVTDEGFDRAISTLADAIRESIPRTSAGQESSMDATEQPSMAGASFEG